MNPILYIVFLKTTAIIISIVLIILGYRLIMRGSKAEYEFSGSFFNQISTTLKSRSPGIFIMLLGVIIILVTLLKQIQVEWQITEEVINEEVSQAEKIEIPKAKEVFEGDVNKKQEEQ